MNQEQENAYNDFLVNVWSKELVRLGILAPDDVVRLINFDKGKHKRLMDKLRVLNISIHDEMVTRFSAFGVV